MIAHFGEGKRTPFVPHHQAQGSVGGKTKGNLRFNLLNSQERFDSASSSRYLQPKDSMALNSTNSVQVPSSSIQGCQSDREDFSKDLSL